DLNVLNFALTLEHLEAKFYEIGLTKFSEQAFAEAGFKSFVRKEFVNINNHEAVHVDFLTQQINKAFGLNMAVPECEYNFDVALSDVKNFVTFASILERTGVSAYDGANHLLTSPDFLTAAAAIATTEGRHAAFLNLITGNSPATGDFDTPLGIQPIVSLAAPLIKSCPFDLPAKPFPTLSVAAQDN
ncbi:ferritin-like domain-containing protein, partial [Chytridium lagenaria]